MELTLETPRLRVRSFRGEDEAALAEILGDPAVMAWIEPPYTPEQTRRFLARAGLGEEKLIWAVLSRDAGRLVGQLIFHPWTGEAWELGWILRPCCWGRGFARELTAAALAWAAERRIPAVVLEHHPEQRATACIARQFQFAYQGRSDGLEVWRRELSPAAGKGAREEYGTGLAVSDQ